MGKLNDEDEVQITDAGAEALEAAAPLERELLRKALGEAVLYVEQMRIVPGGVRDQLRRRWRTLLGWPLP